MFMFRITVDPEVIGSLRNGLFLSLKTKQNKTKLKTLSPFQVLYSYLKRKRFPDFFLLWLLVIFISHNELSHGPRKAFPCPNIQNLEILPCTAKDVIKLTILRGETHPGLGRWALNAITFTFIREKETFQANRIGETQADKEAT